MSGLEDDVRRFFAADGPLAAKVGGYRIRPEQIEMALRVARAVERPGHLVVEAGTGVGKSLGYLVPTLLAALASGERRRIVVSTHTISLQEQLVAKDLPILADLMPRSFVAVVAKGRSNYLAPRRLEHALRTARDTRDGEALVPHLERLDAWKSQAQEGTRQELNPQPDADIWELVQSEHGNCFGQQCPHHSECFYHIARRQAANADLVVVNHSLFFADLALRQNGARVLPDYDIVIFDEAHTLESVAIDHFGERVTWRMARLLLARLDNARVGRGFLRLLPGSETARGLVSEAAHAADELFADVRGFCESAAGGTRELCDGDGFDHALGFALENLAAEMSNLKAGARSKEEELEIHSYITRLDALNASLTAVLRPSDDERVHWAENSATGSQVELHSKPVDISETLRQNLFRRVGTAVLTSATLAVRRQGGLDWICRAVGLDDADKAQFGSPFNYLENVTLRVPGWLDEPRDTQDYLESAAAAIERYIERSEGGAFVLFTSYDFMRRVHAIVLPRMQALGFPVFLHGDGTPRSLMIESFKKSNHSVLFGTDSFWQGVDVQGEQLRLVIVTRLPFPVPAQPLFRARAARLKAKGGDPFKDLSLPEAVIKFKQGFGRLVRTETDRGSVVVLDTRLLTKAYGRTFRDAIPPVRLVED